jgi:hypothetical protein
MTDDEEQNQLRFGIRLRDQKEPRENQHEGWLVNAVLFRGLILRQAQDDKILKS